MLAQTNSRWRNRRRRAAKPSHARLKSLDRGALALAPHRLELESLEPRQLLAANPVISEFMADNDDNVGFGEPAPALGRTTFSKPYPFPDGATPDWIEVFNAGDEALDLQGYHLTDDAANLTRWTFPGVGIAR